VFVKTAVPGRASSNRGADFCSLQLPSQLLGDMAEKVAFIASSGYLHDEGKSLRAYLEMGKQAKRKASGEGGSLRDPDALPHHCLGLDLLSSYCVISEHHQL